MTTKTGVESEDDRDGDVENLHCPMIDYEELSIIRLSLSTSAYEKKGSERVPADSYYIRFHLSFFPAL